jgi:hypothetical protein
VAHSCNPSCSGGRDQEERGSRSVLCSIKGIKVDMGRIIRLNCNGPKEKLC